MPSEDALQLIAAIVEEFKALGVPLAVLMAPPRPLVAGADAVEAAAEGPVGFDRDKAARSFANMTAAVRETGAIMPDLLQMVLQDPSLRAAYYFRRDTHWTPTGAVHSALALSEAVAAQMPGAFPVAGTLDADDLTVSDTLEERGSLSDLAKATCGIALSAERVPMPVLPSTDGDLLSDDRDQPTIALAGTSFSDRYKRDAYRVADAISAAFGAKLMNYSVSGSGAIGGIESLILSGELDPQTVDLVIWELPYTEGLSVTSMLRQLLGALQYQRYHSMSQSVLIQEDSRLEVGSWAPDLIAIHAPNSDVQQLYVDIYTVEGIKTTVQLVRRDHIPAERRADIWPVSVTGLPGGAVQAVKIRAKGVSLGRDAQLKLYGGGGL